jgi:hypothetical protein
MLEEILPYDDEKIPDVTGLFNDQNLFLQIEEPAAPPAV